MAVGTVGCLHQSRRAVLLKSSLAGIAFPAGIDHEADTDEVADGEAADSFADAGDPADDFVSGESDNGIVERFHRTLLDEHFRVEGRRTWFDTIEEMQRVLDDYMAGYYYASQAHSPRRRLRSKWGQFTDEQVFSRSTGYRRARASTSPTGSSNCCRLATRYPRLAVDRPVFVRSAASVSWLRACRSMSRIAAQPGGDGALRLPSAASVGSIASRRSERAVSFCTSICHR